MFLPLVERSYQSAVAVAMTQPHFMNQSRLKYASQETRPLTCSSVLGMSVVEADDCCSTGSYAFEAMFRDGESIRGCLN